MGIQHKWFKGVDCHYGHYIYRDDVCLCGCERRMVLNENNKQEIESYTLNNNTTIIEPKCKRSIRKQYKKFKRNA